MYKESGYFGSKIATNIDGRNKWNYIIYDDALGTWEIKTLPKDNLVPEVYDSLKERYGTMGYDFMP